MGYPLAPGAIDHTYASGSGHIPVIFAAKLLVVFYAMTHLTVFTNTDYEGEIKKQGDTVVVRTLPDISIQDYAKGQNVNYEDLDSDPLTMVIDRGKAFGFNTNPIDDAQFDIDVVPQWSQHAARNMQISIERDFWADIYSDAHATNAGATAGAISGDVNLGSVGAPLALTESNIVQYIVNCGLVLDENNVPEENRKLFLPAWAVALVKQSDIKDASLTGDSSSPLRTGRVGRIDRFEIFSSNLLKNVTDGTDTVACAPFGHPMATSFATQLTENEVLPNPNKFGRLHRGLQVFGWKVFKPEALGYGYITKG